LAVEKAALARAEREILRDHAAHCVSEAFAAGNAPTTKQKLDELIDIFDKSRRQAAHGHDKPPSGTRR